MPTTLRLEYSYNKNVYDTFLDLRKYGELHPVMVKVNIIGKTESNCTEYEIFEELKLFGFIPMKPQYKAKVIEVEANKHIQYLSQIKKNVDMVLNLYFDNSNGITKVVEEIEISGNPILGFILIGIMKKAHCQIFEKLNPVK